MRRNILSVVSYSTTWEERVAADYRRTLDAFACKILYMPLHEKAKKTRYIRHSSPSIVVELESQGRAKVADQNHDISMILALHCYFFSELGRNLPCLYAFSR